MPDETPRPKQPVLGLSMTQLIGGSAAAATAAYLGSRIGVAGTIAGAAVASMASAVAGALYTASIRRTQEVVARTREILPTVAWGTGLRRPDLPDVPDEPDGTEADVAEVETDAEAETPSLWSRVTWKSVAVATGVFFAITAVIVTGTELVTGTSFDGGSRTTFDQVTNDGRRPTIGSSTPTPTPTPSKKPSSDTSSPASVTPTPTPTGTPTPSVLPSVTPSASPTTGPSVSPTPSPTPAPAPAPSTTP